MARADTRRDDARCAATLFKTRWARRLQGAFAHPVRESAAWPASVLGAGFAELFGGSGLEVGDALKFTNEVAVELGTHVEQHLVGLVAGISGFVGSPFDERGENVRNREGADQIRYFAVP